MLQDGFIVFGGFDKVTSSKYTLGKGWQNMTYKLNQNENMSLLCVWACKMTAIETREENKVCVMMEKRFEELIHLQGEL